MRNLIVAGIVGLFYALFVGSFVAEQVGKLQATLTLYYLESNQLPQ